MPNPCSPDFLIFSNRLEASFIAALEFLEVVRKVSDDEISFDEDEAYKAELYFRHEIAVPLAKLRYLSAEAMDTEHGYFAGDAGTLLVDAICPSDVEWAGDDYPSAHTAAEAITFDILQQWDRTEFKDAKLYSMNLIVISLRDRIHLMLKKAPWLFDPQTDLVPLLHQEREAIVRALDAAHAVAAIHGGEPPSERGGRDEDKLNRKDREAANFIAANPGSKGEIIARGISVSYDSFRSRIAPKLRRLGFTNSKNGDGYFAPANWQQPPPSM